jgi:protein-disulfide isomerase
VLDKYPKEVKIVFKNFPLGMHKFARKAAAAALAAHSQKKFWEFHEKLFENYQKLNDAKILEIAKELGLDMEKFNKERNDPAIQNLITRDVKDGMQAGVRGIPAVFINGKVLKNRNFQGFQKIIDTQLNKKR